MKARHIVHESLSPTEYYFVNFKSEQDIIDFCYKCPWFNREDAHLYDNIVIQVNNEEDNFWYEILTPFYFKRYLKKKLSVISLIAEEFDSFFI